MARVDQAALGKQSGSRWHFVLVGLLFLVLAILFFPKSSVIVEADSSPSLKTKQREWPVNCAPNSYQKKIPECTPTSCKRVTINEFIDPEAANQLRKIIDTAATFGGGSGGPTIFDLHSGALSKADKFIDLYAALKKGTYNLFHQSDLEVLSETIQRIKTTIQKAFKVKNIFLTTPLFFSKISGDLDPRTAHDEYWHPHIDKEQYGTFVYTALVYLSDYGVDFEGGSFVFVDKKSNQTIKPSKGLLSFFTSGSENVHHIQRVTKGVRYALTIAFSCDSTTNVETQINQRIAFLKTVSIEEKP